MDIYLAAGIGASATLAAAFINTRPEKAPKRPLPRKETKRRRIWLRATSALVAITLILASIPGLISETSQPIWILGSLFALSLSYLAPIRVAWAVPASLAMILTSIASQPLAAIITNTPLEPHLQAASIATMSAIALATLALVIALNKLRCA